MTIRIRIGERQGLILRYPFTANGGEEAIAIVMLRMAMDVYKRGILSCALATSVPPMYIYTRVPVPREVGEGQLNHQ